MQINKDMLRRIYTKYILTNPRINNFIVRLYKYKKLKNSIKKDIKGKNNTLNMTNTIMLNVKFEIKGNNNQILIEEGSVLKNVRFFIRGDNHTVHIGKNCRFANGSLIWFEDNNCSLIIGDNTLVEDVHFAITEPFSKIVIGKNCMFSHEIDIRTGDSHSIIDKISKKRINYAKNITIGDYVWIAADCKILKGVSIPDNCVIGTSTVVTKSIKDENSISVGNPAKIVKKNIEWKVERIYE